jgi:hypothetical protein
MTSESGPIGESAATRVPPEFERRASLALKAVAVFGAIVAIVLVANGNSPLPAAMFLALVVTYGVTAWLAARAIDGRKRWGLGAAPMLLAVLLLFGVVDFFAAVQQNVLRIPLAGVVAVWALAAPRSTPRLAGRDRRIAAGVVVLFAAASAALTVGPLLASGPFAASESDLNLSLDVACGPVGTAPASPVGECAGLRVVGGQPG